MSRANGQLDWDAPLSSALREHAGLDLAADVGSFTKASRACFLMRPELRVDRHFDVAPMAMIHDPELGTLAIVEAVRLPGGLEAADADVRRQVARHVDAAAYLRHILLRHAGARPALTVELVLLIAAQEEAESLLSTVGDCLRDVLRRTDTAHHIGIGLLLSEDGSLAKGLRRAMPWLLSATRAWLQPSNAEAACEPTIKKTLASMSLVDYRLPGTREFEFAQSGVHLVHGVNGTGKSALAEAIELVVTGKVERLVRADEKDYRQVVRNRNATGEASIKLCLRSVDGLEKEAATSVHTVSSEGIDNPLQLGLSASSFRLDQSLMDRLVGHSPGQRAADFIQAFFPTAAASLEDYNQASSRHQQQLQKLGATVDRLQAGRRALIELGAWRTTAHAAPRRQFPEILEEWLENTALADLGQRARGLLATFGRASDLGWSDDDRVWWDAKDAPVPLQRLAAAAEAYAAKVDELQRQLASFRPSEGPASESTDRITDVTAAQSASLNWVGGLLFPAEVLQAFGQFGDKVARVIGAGDASTFGSVVIGGVDWAAPLQAMIDQMLASCASLHGDKEPLPWPGPIACEDFDMARAAHLDVLASQRELAARFVDRMRPIGAEGVDDGSLIAAINELMALFTPARWGYEDIRLPPKVQNGGVALGLELGPASSSARAELHLNTAELNLFTVALFLLCAGRVPRPLSLLVLDDPLQSMDELTSVALARGLAKVLRLQEKLGWREDLLVLFHGADDLERFRAEVPAAIYRLPWLLPVGVATPQTVKPDSEGWKFDDVQSLEGLLTPQGA